MELLHNLQHCLHALKYSIDTHELPMFTQTHTHYTPAVAEVVLPELLDVCIFLSYLLVEKDQ